MIEKYNHTNVTISVEMPKYYTCIRIYNEFNIVERHKYNV